MPNSKFKTRVWPVLAILLLISSCGHREPATSYTQAYIATLESTESEPVSAETVKQFGDVFNNLQSANLARIIDQVYADSFYFNDTFRTVTDKAGLITYLEETGDAVHAIAVKIEDIAQSEQNRDVYVRWTMTMQFTVKGKLIDSQSVGVTHLRYDDNGQIIVHHDYWDGVDGFYQHLPVIGFWLRKIRDQL